VLNFTSIGSAFGNFSRPADFTRFQRRMAQYGAVWCCVDAHPGHVHYDLWWDTHHTDKFGRKWGRGREGAAPGWPSPSPEEVSSPERCAWPRAASAVRFVCPLPGGRRLAAADRCIHSNACLVALVNDDCLDNQH
jgi:hypothetical protein